jgi:hypothetical protein
MEPQFQLVHSGVLYSSFEANHVTLAIMSCMCLSVGTSCTNCVIVIKFSVSPISQWHIEIFRIWIDFSWIQSWSDQFPVQKVNRWRDSNTIAIVCLSLIFNFFVYHFRLVPLKDRLLPRKVNWYLLVSSNLWTVLVHTGTRDAMAVLWIKLSSILKLSEVLKVNRTTHMLLRFVFFSCIVD